jgi:fengycin family lipopeptide synthetase D
MSETTDVLKSNIEDILPLTPMQESMLFQYLQDPHNGQYLEQLTLYLSGKVDTTSFMKAWNFVAGNNEILRTVFRWEKLEQPVQIIFKQYELPIREADLTGSAPARRQGLLREIIAKDREEGVNISAAPLRITLCKMSEREYAMMISNHHILYDGWSNGILLKEFFDAYTRIDLGQEPISLVKFKFKEFIKWQRAQSKAKQQEYWRQYLRGFETKTTLPVSWKKRNSGAERRVDTAEFTAVLPVELAGRLDQFVQSRQITKAIVFYAAWGILLQKYNDSGDVVFGTIISGRPHQLKGIEQCAGLFINTLPLRVTSGSGECFSDILETIQYSLHAREEFESASLTEIKQYSAVSNQDSLFDSIIAVENYPLDSGLKDDNHSLRVTGYETVEKTNFDLTLAVMLFDEIQIKWIYHTGIFHPEIMESLARHYTKVIAAIIDTPGLQPARLDLLADDEKHRLLYDFNHTHTHYPKAKTLPELFQEQAVMAPEAIALRLDERTLTYKELNARANRLAQCLRRKGVGSNAIVGLLMERSLEMIIGIFGILKAGGAYLPLEPDYPGERVKMMLDDAETAWLITEPGLLEAMALDPEEITANGTRELLFCKQVLADHSPDSSLAGQSESMENLPVVNDAGSLAYVMYTSGSTGKPKGILTTHYNISRVVKQTNYIEITPDDILIQLSNYAFDGSTFDIFGALLNGATLVLAPKPVLQDLDRLADLIQKEKISVFFVTTALFNTLADHKLEALKSVRRILFGGERVSTEHVRKALHVLGPGRLIHVYGPTESTVFATFHIIHQIDDASGTIPIGRPLANTKVFIVNRDLQLQPPGISGELCLSGDGLAKGYLKRPELTAEKFVPNPYFPDEVMYKTGDLARLLPDGEIEFLDRLDTQVKLRGFRIEPGEIETALLQSGMVKEAVVLALDDPRGGKYLCAYLVPDSYACAYGRVGANLDLPELKQQMSRSLPEYMIPTSFITLEKMPLNSNGKIDRKALPLPESAADYAAAQYLPPTTETETRLVRIWQEVLGRESIGIQDDFFEMGGHSLKATVLASKIHKEFNHKIPLAEIFSRPTIKEIGDYLNSNRQTGYESIPPAASGPNYPVSAAQKRLFVQEQSAEIGISYNIPIVLKLEGKPDRERLIRAFQHLVERHEPLRTSFTMVAGDIVQVIRPEVELSIRFVELEIINDEVIRGYITPFKLDEASLFKVTVFKVADERHLLLIDLHHIIADGIGVAILLREFVALYEGRELPELRIQYKDFAAWQDQLTHQGAYRADQEYWGQVLAGELPVLQLPTDHPRPEQRTYHGQALRFTLAPERVAELNQLARKQKVTLNSLLFATYGILLYKYTAQPDFVLGTLVAGRNHPDLENVVGMFNNFLPIRLALNSSMDFGALLQDTSQAMLNAFAHQDYPYDQMIQDLGVKTERSRNPLFDTMLIFHNELETLEYHAAGLKITPDEFDTATAKLDLKLDIYPGAANGLQGILEYNSALFQRATVARMAEHFQNIAAQICAHPTITLDAVEMLSTAEKRHIMEDFNCTTAGFPREMLLHQFLERQESLTPEKIALVFEEEALSYGTLNRKANQLARTLRKYGAKPNDIIGLVLERSPEMVIGIMGILKAGSAYLPISPEYPAERIQYLLKDSGAALVLTTGKWKNQFIPGAYELIDLEAPEIYRGDGSNPEPVNTPEDLAYIIYTSGSTGKPKGAMIEHHSVVNRTHWMQQQYPLAAGDVILQKTPYTFDVSVWELFWWSFAGAKVCMLVPGGEKDPAVIAAAIAQEQVTTIHFVPSMLAIFLEYCQVPANLAKVAGLRKVFASGEALTPPQVKLFNRLLHQSSGAVLINLYGPTEATVDVSYFNCSPGAGLANVPIGKPIDNINLYIVDSAANQLQPVGIPGELCISGEGVGRGYLNRPELTLEKFPPDPFKPGQRMYRTGDRARFLPDGNIEYLGRLDHQIKIRGFRIELGEIENSLLTYPAVKAATVIDRTDSRRDKYLCAYYTATGEVDAAALKQHLAQRLPEYMIPKLMIRLERMPLSPNGKVDRRALPEPAAEIGLQVAAFVAPETSGEKKLAKLWEELLETGAVSVTDNFFARGGDSLKAASLALRIYQEFQVELPLREVFANPVLNQLAAAIGQKEPSAYQEIRPVDAREYYPVSSAQQRLYIIQQIEGMGTAYNLPGVLTIEGMLDRERLAAVFSRLVERHEPLRTSFALVDGEPMQKVHPVAHFVLEYRKSGCRESGTFEPSEQIRDFIRPFDLGEVPLFRVRLVRLGSARHLLMFDMNHIIADGISMVVLVKEFIQLYRGEELPPLRIQYKDFTLWQNEFLLGNTVKKQEAYWLDLFKGEIPLLNLPTDFPRPLVQSFEGNKVRFYLNPELTANLRKLAFQTGATLYMVLLATYNVLLYKYTGQDDLIIGTPIAGRSHPELENLIGMFVNMLAIRSFPKGPRTFLEFLGEVKDRAIRAFENQDFQFERLIEKLNLNRDVSRNPLFDTAFVLQNMGIPEVKLEGLQFLPCAYEEDAAKYDLTFELVETGDQVQVDLRYCAKLFKPETMERMAQHYLNIVQAIIQNPALRLADINMLTESEVQQLLVDFNMTGSGYPREQTLVTLFESQAARVPEHIAVIFEGQSLIYREVNRQANRLAAVLREKGVRPNQIIALLLDRSPSMIIGMLAILKAGGAYLPLDPNHPQNRVLAILNDSRTAILLSETKVIQNNSFAGLQENSMAEIIAMDHILQGDNGVETNPVPVNQPSDLAYVIYTSGSTGQAKGAMIEHRNVVRLLFNDRFAFDFSDQDVWTMFHSYTFDFSVWEMYGALLYGGKLVMVPKLTAQNPAQYLELLKRERVTVLNQVPSVFYNLIHEELQQPDAVLNLRYIIFGGEALQPFMLKQWHEKYPATRIINMYGITETTVHVTYKEILAAEIALNISNIGVPIPTLTTYIMDPDLNLLPVGIPGELCVGGAGVGRGYLNRPELTAERFANHPYRKGERLYRSGDLARLLPNGEMEYLGRIDFQVKIRGFRIELGEIESLLLRHPQITQAVVIADAGDRGEKYLAAYFIAHTELSVARLRAYLGQDLPDYMIPSYFIQVDRIPLTANGKVDRRALPKPGQNINTGETYLAPTNDVELQLESIWKNILHVEQIGINDNFFDLGGNSLLLIKMHAGIEEQYPGKLKITDIFANATIAKLAEFISRPDSSVPAVKLQPLPLPAEYFNTGDANTGPTVFKFSFGGELFTKSATWPVPPLNMLLSVYAYLLAEISGRQELCVQVVAGVAERVVSLELDLANLDSFDELCRFVTEKLQNPEPQNVYPLIILQGMRDETKSPGIIPLFYDRRLLAPNPALWESFDLGMGVFPENNGWSGICEFNEKRLAKEPLKELINLYVKAAKLLAGELETQSGSGEGANQNLA